MEEGPAKWKQEWSSCELKACDAVELYSIWTLLALMGYKSRNKNKIAETYLQPIDQHFRNTTQVTQNIVERFTIMFEAHHKHLI